MNSRLSDTEECISDLDGMMEISQSEQKKEKETFKNESNLRNHWNNIKHSDIHIIGFPEGEEKRKGIEKVFEEIMADNFLNLKKETDIQVQEAQRVPN